MDEDALPPKLNLDGIWEQVLSLLYGVFKRDFIELRVQFMGFPVLFDNRKTDSDYEEGFWHVITKGKDSRILDYKRAKRLPWLKPLIEFGDDPDILKWEEEELDRKRGGMQRKYFIWYKRGSYLVILKRIPNKYFLTTAFYVTGERERKYYWNKYQAWIKKGNRD